MDTNYQTTNSDTYGQAKEKKGISGSTLKMIAIITMLIDHTGAAVLGRMLMANGMAGLDGTDIAATMQWLSENGTLYYAYMILRMIVPVWMKYLKVWILMLCCIWVHLIQITDGRKKKKKLFDILRIL